MKGTMSVELSKKRSEKALIVLKDLLNINMSVKVFVVLAFGFTLLIACNKSKPVSMFFFFPTTVSELKKNGYIYNDTTGFFVKKVKDTLESIREMDEKKGTFSKHFYINCNTPQSENDRFDGLTLILNNITSKSDEIILNYPNSKLLRINEYMFAIFSGYSAKKTFYRISYYNMKTESDRKYAIEQFEQLKKIYSTLEDSEKIDKAISFAKGIK